MIDCPFVLILIVFDKAQDRCLIGRLWSMKFVFAYGEITNIGTRGPYPQRSRAEPAGAWPHSPWGPSSLSFLWSLDWLTIEGITWSYHPSESSYAIMTAVLFHSGSLCKRLIVLTRKFCSSSGSEYPGCPFWYLGAFMKLTAGTLPDCAAPQKSIRYTGGLLGQFYRSSLLMLKEDGEDWL